MKLIYGQHPEIERFIARGLPHLDNGFGECVTIGVANRKNELIGGMVYHNWQPSYGVIEMSGLSIDPNWLTLTILHDLFSYPFDQIKCQLVVMRVSENNKRLDRILTAYGFEKYRIPRLRGRNESETIWTLTEENWRDNKFEKRLRNGINKGKASVAA